MLQLPQKMNRWRATAVAFGLTLGVSITARAQQAPDAEQKSPARRQGERLFAEKIFPLLENKCFGCHGEDAKKIKSEFDARSLEGVLRGGESGKPALVPGDPDKSPMFIAVTWADEDLQMPPKENDRLSAEQIASLGDAKYSASGFSRTSAWNRRSRACVQAAMKSSRGQCASCKTSHERNDVR